MTKNKTLGDADQFANEIYQQHHNIKMQKCWDLAKTTKYSFTFLIKQPERFLKTLELERQISNEGDLTKVAMDLFSPLYSPLSKEEFNT